MKRYVKYGKQKVQVDIASSKCLKYKCLSIGKYRHVNETIDGSTKTWEDNFYVCLRRAYMGCSNNLKEE